MSQRATSCCLYIHRSRPIVIQHQHNQSNLNFFYFCPSFLFFLFFQLDLLAAATTSNIVVVHTSPSSRRRLARGGAPHQSLVAPLTAIGPDKTEQSDLRNWTIQFLQFRAGAFGLCLFRVVTHFDDPAGESTTSSTLSMKGENSGHNGSDLDKGYILKPTFVTLTEEDRMAFELYHTNLGELFLSCCEVTRQGTVLKDTTPIVFTKPEVIPEV
jgi:hypothetical protein